MTTITKPTDRPTLTAAERRSLREEYDSYPRGDVRRGALLRRQGRYTSQMAKWRERAKRGAMTLETHPARQTRAPLRRHDPEPLPVEMQRPIAVGLLITFIVVIAVIMLHRMRHQRR